MAPGIIVTCDGSRSCISVHAGLHNFSRISQIWLPVDSKSTEMLLVGSIHLACNMQMLSIKILDESDCPNDVNENTLMLLTCFLETMRSQTVTLSNSHVREFSTELDSILACSARTAAI